MAPAEMPEAGSRKIANPRVKDFGVNADNKAER
jgi:hypothetical protein